ncbi:MAG: pantoate--beta-alanine ligase [Hyphomicrobiales bacterium]|nr:pantoate--beta-alanine ligase [Hyphomicrobiales bacterium]
MSTGTRIARTLEQLRHQVADWRAQGLRTALVPTMGALHEGHLTLVRQGLRRADRVIVTIFVNPKQFGQGEDLERYPRDEKGDARKLKKAGANLIFIPGHAIIYPEGFATTVSLAGPAKVGLEDKSRPHFFDGVTTIVAKLFIQAGCDYAMFGEKDYQQLKIVTRMAWDLDIATAVIGVETVREPDGLAMSSRNAYLSRNNRNIAPLIHQCLNEAAAAIQDGKPPAKATSSARQKLTKAGFKVDYLTARNAETLKMLKSPNEPVRLLAAAWLGDTRLIDNIAV